MTLLATEILISSTPTIVFAADRRISDTTDHQGPEQLRTYNAGPEESIHRSSLERSRAPRCRRGL